MCSEKGAAALIAAVVAFFLVHYMICFGGLATGCGRAAPLVQSPSGVVFIRLIVIDKAVFKVIFIEGFVQLAGGSVQFIVFVERFVERISGIVRESVPLTRGLPRRLQETIALVGGGGALLLLVIVVLETLVHVLVVVYWYGNLSTVALTTRQTLPHVVEVAVTALSPFLHRLFAFTLVCIQRVDLNFVHLLLACLFLKLVVNLVALICI